MATKCFTLSKSISNLLLRKTPNRFLCIDACSAVKTLRSRLLWQSKKRGILENDILLGGFAEENLQKMSAHELAKYDEMINGKHMEWDLYYYFTGRKEAPPDLVRNPVFMKIRNYVLQMKSND